MEANGAQILARGTNLVSKEGNIPLRAVLVNLKVWKLHKRLTTVRNTKQPVQNWMVMIDRCLF